MKKVTESSNLIALDVELGSAWFEIKIQNIIKNKGFMYLQITNTSKKRNN